ncbi:MAG: hypothetical protein K1Y01_13040 [Vicinamibacteria bacterium]|nr:hypothetical protein [Vicinamibacteria bacterium]
MTEKKSPHRLFPHGEFQRLAPNLWIVRGGLPFPLYRNMVVYRLADGRLLLHSLVALSEAGMKQLEALGRPSIMVIPNAYDGMDAPWYFERYPQASFLTPDEERAGVAEYFTNFADDPARVLPSLGIRLRKVEGLKFTEYVLEAPVEGGTALIFNNTLDNRGACPPGFLGRLVDAAVMTGGRLAPGRMLRAFMVKDRAAFRNFLATLSTIPNVKIVTVSHGDAITDGDLTARLQEAAA